MAEKTIRVKVSPVVFDLLRVLGNDEIDVKGVIERLIDHAQQGVYRPGAWEREWVCQAFGHDWIDNLVAGDPHGRPGCEGIFRKPGPRHRCLVCGCDPCACKRPKS